MKLQTADAAVYLAAETLGHPRTLSHLEERGTPVFSVLYHLPIPNQTYGA